MDPWTHEHMRTRLPYFASISVKLMLGWQLMQPRSFFSSFVSPQRLMVLVSSSMEAPGFSFSSFELAPPDWSPDT